jgi:transposase
VRRSLPALAPPADRSSRCRGIPPKSNRKVKRDCAFALYCERNLVERFFCKIKHFRAIATRYEKDGTKLPGRITSGLRAGVA